MSACRSASCVYRIQFTITNWIYTLRSEPDCWLFTEGMQWHVYYLWKYVPVIWSVYWSDSKMLQPKPNSSCPRAATTPFWSGHCMSRLASCGWVVEVLTVCSTVPEQDCSIVSQSTAGKVNQCLRVIVATRILSGCSRSAGCQVILLQASLLEWHCRKRQCSSCDNMAHVRKSHQTWQEQILGHAIPVDAMVGMIAACGLVDVSHFTALSAGWWSDQKMVLQAVLSFSQSLMHLCLQSPRCIWPGCRGTVASGGSNTCAACMAPVRLVCNTSCGVLRCQ